ncbi:hypothetical protein GCK72_007739 [Caenorhabditis remanei]|uniref:SPK domain-containing protein n=1 Tax=Caenorhabditis remanei TaxID=31234 RepID=A0A6A5HI17_CAERE|nr:hypothetical protein GCK72_007739 [Caenorhabditis remanei]KAF1767780.1 hypothetical protein GCK72_007739 [Caenorhabditis remanei]
MEALDLMAWRLAGCENSEPLWNDMKNLGRDKEISLVTLAEMMISLLEEWKRELELLLCQHSFEDSYMSTLCSERCEHSCGGRMYRKRVVTPKGRYHVMMVDHGGNKSYNLTTDSIVEMFGFRWTVISFAEFCPRSNGHYVSWMRCGTKWKCVDDAVVKMESRKIIFSEHNKIHVVSLVIDFSSIQTAYFDRTSLEFRSFDGLSTIIKLIEKKEVLKKKQPLILDTFWKNLVSEKQWIGKWENFRDLYRKTVSKRIEKLHFIDSKYRALLMYATSASVTAQFQKDWLMPIVTASTTSTAESLQSDQMTVKLKSRENTEKCCDEKSKNQKS